MKPYLVAAIAFSLFLGMEALARVDRNGPKKAYDRGDYLTAVKGWSSLAEKGDAHAQFHMGIMLENGLGITQEASKAADWYRLAADQGIAGAQQNLALMYHQGRGVARDLDEASKWYAKAEAAGVAEASHYLTMLKTHPTLDPVSYY